MAQRAVTPPNQTPDPGKKADDAACGIAEGWAAHVGRCQLPHDGGGDEQKQKRALCLAVDEPDSHLPVHLMHQGKKADADDDPGDGFEFIRRQHQPARFPAETATPVSIALRGPAPRADCVPSRRAPP